MTSEVRFNAGLSAAATRTDVADGQVPVNSGNNPEPILGGENVKVTSGIKTDLEKLVARLKNESENTRTDLAHMRLSAVLVALDTMNVRLTKEQETAFATISEQQKVKDGLDQKLKNLYADYGISPGGNAGSVVMEAEIAALEKAVERAIAEGKAHNEAVAKAKEQKSMDQEEIDKMEEATAKYDAAIAAAQANLDKARTDAATMAELESGIREASSKIDSAMNILGDKKIGEIAEALSKLADGADDNAHEHVSQADRDKAEAKEIANNPFNIISDALDRIDEAILRTIDENQFVKA